MKSEVKMAALNVATESSNRKQKRPSVFCEHCERSLPHATFYRHRERYYDENSGSWSQLYHSDDESIESENSEAIRKSLWPRSLHGDSSYIALRLTALLRVSGAFNCAYYVHFVASDVTLGDNNMWCADDDSGSSDEDGTSSVEVSVCEVTNYTSQLGTIVKDLHFD